MVFRHDIIDIVFGFRGFVVVLVGVFGGDGTGKGEGAEDFGGGAAGRRIVQGSGAYPIDAFGSGLVDFECVAASGLAGGFYGEKVFHG